MLFSGWLPDKTGSGIKQSNINWHISLENEWNVPVFYIPFSCRDETEPIDAKLKKLYYIDINSADLYNKPIGVNYNVS